VPLFARATHRERERERERDSVRERKGGTETLGYSFTGECYLKAVNLGGWAHLNCVFIIKTVSGLISPIDSI